MKITGQQGTPPASTALTNPTEVGGDLSGTIPDNATVVGIGNVPISGLPSDGDTIVYDVTTNTYIFGVPSIEDAGHYEVVMADGVTAPPEPVTNEAEDDWVYGWVSD